MPLNATDLWTTLKERFSGVLPITYEVSENVDGGCAVMYDSANPGKVKLCTAANSHLALGVAKYFASPSNEFAETGGGRVRGLVLNEPVPWNVAVFHIGVYDVVNDGPNPINPGDPVYVINDNGRLGLPTTLPTNPRAVIGTCLGLHNPNNRGATNARPCPAGQKMRVRFGRG